MAHICSNDGCEKKGASVCSKCNEAYYCGRDCQLAHFTAHKGPCKEARAAAQTRLLSTIGPSNSDPSTVYLGLNDIKTKHPEEWTILLQEIFNVTTISIVFLGGSEEFEGSMDCKSLLGLLKILFPTMTKLNVGLIGPETSGAPERQISPGLTIRKINGLFHSVYGQLPVYFQKPSIAVLLCPGFNADQYKSLWHPSMKFLLDNNTLCVVSGYSHKTKWTGDGAVDDYLLEARFVGTTYSISSIHSVIHLLYKFLSIYLKSLTQSLNHSINQSIHTARTIVPKTRSPAANLKKPLYYRNAYYLVFRGRVMGNPQPVPGLLSYKKHTILS